MGLSLTVASGPVSEIDSDILVAVVSQDIALFREKSLDRFIAPLHQAFRAETLRAERFIELPPEFKTRQLLVYFADSHRNMGLENKTATAVSTAVSLCTARGFRTITLLLNTGKPHLSDVLQGLLIGPYAFKRYKSKQDKSEVAVRLHVLKPSVQACRALVEREARVAGCVNECRDLVNEPANIAGTDEILRRTKAVAQECGFKITVFEKDELKRRGFNGLLTVGAGGHNPPRMVILEYNSNKKAKTHLCLLGKGIAFDSGGISLKPAEAMWTMKADMAGAAAVLYGLKTLSLLKAPVKATAIMCLAENLPDSNASRPGDIFIAANGKSVHVDNTDAEGRLILSDGLFMAGQIKATHIVDFATLTGACVVALGEHIAGLMGNNEGLIRAVQSASRVAGDPVWRLPLPPEYKSMLETPCADINNITGSRWGGALAGGLFLSEFVPENTAWAHVDMAGPAFTLKKWLYFNEGATGFGVRLIANLPQTLPRG